MTAEDPHIVFIYDRIYIVNAICNGMPRVFLVIISMMIWHLYIVQGKQNSKRQTEDEKHTRHTHTYTQHMRCNWNILARLANKCVLFLSSKIRQHSREMQAVRKRRTAKVRERERESEDCREKLAEFLLKIGCAVCLMVPIYEWLVKSWVAFKGNCIVKYVSCIQHTMHILWNVYLYPHPHTFNHSHPWFSSWNTKHVTS